MYNFRLKKICQELQMEISRGDDDQIKELYDIVVEEYNNRHNLKKRVAKKR